MINYQTLTRKGLLPSHHCALPYGKPFTNFVAFSNYKNISSPGGVCDQHNKLHTSKVPLLFLFCTLVHFDYQLNLFKLATPNPHGIFIRVTIIW